MDQEGSQVPREVQVPEQTGKAKVHIYGRDLGMEFLLSKTLPKLDTAAKKLALMWEESYNKFAHCLDGPALMAWHETLHCLPDVDCNVAANFTVVTDELIKKTPLQQDSMQSAVDISVARFQSVQEETDDIPK